MSNLEQLSAQQDWREQYSQYLPPTDSAIISSHYEQSTGFNSIQASTDDRQFIARPQLGHRHSIAHLESTQNIAQTISNDRPDSTPGDCGQNTNGIGQDSVGNTESTERLLTSIPLDSTLPPVLLKRETSPNLGEDVKQIDVKEGEDEDVDDDDDEMLDPEDGTNPPQTEAERRAERRKMKRFRLTHQQTRFLMSEFAKQAHPDAAHRERLSREIPGLSPRQVQVWFQNRRAKIKRLTADDRERMMKMRAVPDGFDNLQALHSPYGAVQGIGTPIPSPVDYASSYGDQNIMRPLMVDTMRRQENDEQHISPTGLSSAFGHVGFSPSVSMGPSDVLSPLSMTSSDRYFSSTGSPLSAGPRSSNPFNRQTPSDSYQTHLQPKNHRPLQPLQLRETMSRNRSQSLQSPLRSSMSWKDDALNYANYLAGPTSPTLTGRQQSHYQPDQPGSNPVTAHHYDTNTYSNFNNQTSPSRVAYPTSQPNQQPLPTRTDLRFSSSSALLTQMEQRAQYHSQGAQQLNSDGNSPSTSRESAFNGSFAAVSTGFASAPLSAPSDFQLPRTPVDIGSRDYQMNQMSAPMDPPQDFTNAYNQLRPSQAERALHIEQTQHRSPDRNVQDQLADHAGFLGQEDYGIGRGHKRKRTISMPVPFKGL